MNSLSEKSIDGFNSHYDIHKYSVFTETPLNESVSQIKQSLKIPNNKFQTCPAVMNDGRTFTDYRSSETLNSLLRTTNNVTNNYDYRRYLTTNASSIMNNCNNYYKEKLSCDSCIAKPIECKTFCDVNNVSVQCNISKMDGIGVCYKTIPLPPSVYANNLSNLELASA